MSKSILHLTCIILVVLACATAQAKLVSFESDSVSNWSPSGAVIAQGGTGPSGISITAESHSTFTVTSTVTNETGFTWTGYLLELDPAEAATFINASGGSTKFNNISYPDDWTILFESPQVVDPGQVVTLQFDVNIPDSGEYTFTLTQTPIPEPATFALLAAGGVLFLRKRRSV